MSSEAGTETQYGAESSQYGSDSARYGEGASETRSEAPGAPDAGASAPGESRADEPRGEQPRRPREPPAPKDTIYIGKKPLMAYVTSALLQLASLPSINIKARGMSIARAVDVAQIISRKSDSGGYAIGQISIDSETLESSEGKQRNVSTIDIEIRRN